MQKVAVGTTLRGQIGDGLLEMKAKLERETERKTCFHWELC